MLDMLRLAFAMFRIVGAIAALYALGLHGPIAAILSMAIFVWWLYRNGAMEPGRDRQTHPEP